MNLVELKRLYSEWSIKLQRVQEIVNPTPWTEGQWNQFARALSFIVQKYGNTWEEDITEYWDIRWDLQNGGELICQVEEVKDQKFSLTVAQRGGFATDVDEYIWFYSELSEQGDFLGEPFWVEGNWKDALAMILLPHQAASTFYLGDSTVPMHNHLLTQSSDG